MLFYFACEAAGASSARHSLRPLNFQMRFMASKTRAATGGEIAEVWLETVWLFDIEEAHCAVSNHEAGYAGTGRRSL
jgi:hypothetical protein